jgi:hypothetical protein
MLELIVWATKKFWRSFEALITFDLEEICFLARRCK